MAIPLNPTESYIDLSINEQDFSSISLSLQLSLNDISFCITDNSQANYLAIVCYVFTEKATTLTLCDFIKQLFEYQPLLKKEFSQVTVSYKNNSATLVPSELYDASQLSAYLAFMKEDTANQSVVSDFIKEIDAYNVYLLPQCIEKVIYNKFANAKFIHSSTSFIQGILSNYDKAENADKVFVNINNNELGLVIVKQGKFHVYNSFDFKMKEDFLYYLLFTMKQFNCNPDNAELILMGKIAEQSSIHQLLVKYIGDVDFAKNNLPVNLSTLLNEVPEYYYFTLSNLSKCV